ncbi:MAG: hypothetical protein J2P36_32055 [Ktedonobacteraceae bacterium]|nr:hypothetical protein [Ktedonobacteraceae bacterium]
MDNKQEQRTHEQIVRHVIDQHWGELPQATIDALTSVADKLAEVAQKEQELVIRGPEAQVVQDLLSFDEFTHELSDKKDMIHLEAGYPQRESFITLDKEDEDSQLRIIQTVEAYHGELRSNVMTFSHVNTNGMLSWLLQQRIAAYKRENNIPEDNPIDLGDLDDQPF